MEEWQINGFLFSKKAFENISIILHHLESEDDTLKIYYDNGYKFLYKVGEEDCDNLTLEIYKRYTQNGEKSTPLYMIQVWEVGMHEHENNTFFADSILDFNYLLKEIKSLIDLAKYFEEKGRD